MVDLYLVAGEVEFPENKIFQFSVRYPAREANCSIKYKY